MVQIEMYEQKLSTAEQLHEATRRELETAREDHSRLRGDYEHVRRQLDDSLATVASVVEEVKGLTVALYREQEQRQLAGHAKDQEEHAANENPKKPGFLRRVFTGKPKRTRKGKFARVGPS